MEFKLSTELSDKLIRYDSIRKSTVTTSKTPKKPAEYPLGLPPIEKMLPKDVLPLSVSRKKLIKDISNIRDHRYRWHTMSWPKVTDKYPQIGYEDHLFKPTDRRVTWDSHRVKRNIIIYHHESMWVCLWVPHTYKYIYGYSFAFRDNKTNQKRYESHPINGHNPNRIVFCRKGGRWSGSPKYDHNKPKHLFLGWSWNDCESIKIGSSNWKYKTVYVTKEMLKAGHTFDPTFGMFYGRDIEGRKDKDESLAKRLHDFRVVLYRSIPQWKKEHGRHDIDHWSRYYRSRCEDMFDRCTRNSLATVIADKFEPLQQNWKSCSKEDREEYNAPLLLKDNFKWDVRRIKDLLYRLHNKECMTLYERRHNISHPLWKKDGWIEQPFFRRLLHLTLKDLELRMENSQEESKDFVVIPLEQMSHFIQWIHYVLRIWPDTPVDYFQNYYKYLMEVQVPWQVGQTVKESTDPRDRFVTGNGEAYLGRMPVKTFLEYIRKIQEEQMEIAKKRDEITNYYKIKGRWGFEPREWNDTIGMLRDVMNAYYNRNQRFGELDKAKTETDLTSPRRWRITELHDHVMAEQWKNRNENEDLPQDLFPKPIHVKLSDLTTDPNLDLPMWQDITNDKRICFLQPKTTHMLADWGRAVRNCVGNSSYSQGVKKKKYFIVLTMINNEPRYTVQLKLSDGTLLVDQILDVANRNLSQEEKSFVQLAFARAFDLRSQQIKEESK